MFVLEMYRDDNDDAELPSPEHGPMLYQYQNNNCIRGKLLIDRLWFRHWHDMKGLTAS